MKRNVDIETHPVPSVCTVASHNATSILRYAFIIPTRTLANR